MPPIEIQVSRMGRPVANHSYRAIGVIGKLSGHYFYFLTSSRSEEDMPLDRSRMVGIIMRLKEHGAPWPIHVDETDEKVQTETVDGIPIFKTVRRVQLA